MAPAARGRWERLGIVLFAGVLIGTAPVAMNRMLRGHSDFDGFYRAGRFVLEQRARADTTILAYYWPSLDVAWAALGAMPEPVAAAAWYLLNVLSWVGLLRTISERLLADWPEDQRRQAVLGAGLLLTPLALPHFCLGAFHVMMLWLMVAGLADAAEGRWRRGGMLLGLAIWMKLLPALAAGYLVWKRQWKPALLAVLVAVVLNASLSVAGLGAAGAWKAHVRWFHKQVQGVTAGLMNSPYPTPEYRSSNQSLPAVMRRVLTVTWVEEPNGSADMYTLAQLSCEQLQILYRAAILLLAGLLAAVFWGPAWRATRGRSALEIALVCLTTIWFSPVAWSYHFLAVTPAMALILVRKHHDPVAVWSLVALWIVALALLGSPNARSYGEMLITSAVLAVAACRLSRFTPAGETCGARP